MIIINTTYNYINTNQFIMMELMYIIINAVKNELFAKNYIKIIYRHLHIALAYLYNCSI